MKRDSTESAVSVLGFGNTVADDLIGREVSPYQFQLLRLWGQWGRPDLLQLWACIRWPAHHTGKGQMALASGGVGVVSWWGYDFSI